MNHMINRLVPDKRLTLVQWVTRIRVCLWIVPPCKFAKSVPDVGLAS
jgi:hypothetical protein